MNYYPLLRRAKAGNRLRGPRVQVKGWTGAGCTWPFCRDAPGGRLFAGVPWPLRAQLSSLSVKLGQQRDGLPEPRLRRVSRGRLRPGPGRRCGRPAPGSGAWGVRRLSVLALRPLSLRPLPARVTLSVIGEGPGRLSRSVAGLGPQGRTWFRNLEQSWVPIGRPGRLVLERGQAGHQCCCRPTLPMGTVVAKQGHSAGYWQILR